MPPQRKSKDPTHDKTTTGGERIDPATDVGIAPIGPIVGTDEIGPIVLTGPIA